MKPHPGPRLGPPLPVYEFGDCRLDRERGTLRRGGSEVALTPKAYEALVLLLERPGHLFAKDELIAALWPATHIEENNLPQQISALRKALGDGNGGGHRYIETVPRRGYRFVAAVRELGPAEARSEDAARARPVPAADAAGPGDGAAAPLPPAGLALPPRGRLRRASGWVITATLGLALMAVATLRFDRGGSRAELARVHSLAVLPFASLGGAAAADDEVLGLGLADALITRLGTVERLAVRPTSAVRRYAGASADRAAAGRQLRVDAVLDGTVQRSRDRTRVTVQLVGARDGETLWSGQFEAQATELFALEDTISAALLGELAAELSAEERARMARHRAVDTAAYAAYLRGRYHWNRRTRPDFQTAIRLFEQAIARDPGFAAAHAGLANTHNLLGEHALAAVSARRALELDPRSAEAHAALGSIRLFRDRDWPGAERELRRAIALNPSYATAHQWLAFLEVALGRFPAAVAMMRRARDLDPTSPILQTDLGEILYQARRHDEALAELEAAVQIDPSFAQSHQSLAGVYLALGRIPDAVSAEGRAARLAGGNPLPLIAMIHAHSGEPEDARERVRGLDADPQAHPYTMALAHLALGEPTDALAWLERAAAQRDGQVVLAAVDPRLDALRGDPRFSAFLRRLGLPILSSPAVS